MMYDSSGNTGVQMLQLYIAATQTVTMVAGGFVTLLAFRAYRRTGAPALRALALGLGLVTAGALLAGVVHQVGETNIATAVAIQSTAMALGFTVLAYSLYAEGPASSESDDDTDSTGSERLSA
jgi:hypothetical protein